MTKAVIGITVVAPIAVYIFLNYKQYKIMPLVILGAAGFSLPIVPWWEANVEVYRQDFINRTIFIGLRTNSYQKPNLLELHRSLTFVYLHFGVAKWYYPQILAFLASLLFVFRDKKLLPFIVWIVVLLVGFLTNKQTEIWHIIPLYVPLAILLAYSINKIALLIDSGFAPLTRMTKSVLPLLATVAVIAASLWQIYQFRHGVGLFDKSSGGMPKVAQAAQERAEPLFLYADFFKPAAVFYSRKKVGMLPTTLKDFVQNSEKPSLLLAEGWKLQKDNVNKNSYRTLAESEGHVLILTIPE